MLQHIEVVGFRGIRRLSLDCTYSLALIGENAWGKSSLFDAISLVFNSQQQLYKFRLADFHTSPDTEQASSRISLVFTLKERFAGQYQKARYRAISPLWIGGSKSCKRIYFQLEASINDSGQVITERRFLNSRGQVINLDSPNAFAKQLISFFPALRFSQDNAFLSETDVTLNHSLREQSEQLINKLCQRVSQTSQPLLKSELTQSFNALEFLFEQYLSPRFAHLAQQSGPRKVRDMGLKPVSFRAIENLSELLKSGHSRHTKAALLVMLGAYLRARGPNLLRRGCSPIFLLEEPESRLHPINLLTSWSLFEQLPVQKIVATNSADLLATFPLSQVTRLVRRGDNLSAFKVEEQDYSSDEFRRIAFHVRINRPASLLARCWLMVEGETEFWLLTELARVCGLSFAGEGIRIVEFAQCGVKPLLKVANDMGIEWHLLTDGDEAGKKYANHAKSFVSGEMLSERLTLLPAHDMEHFLYHHGFDGVFIKQAKLKSKDALKLGPSKVIERAISRLSKPRLALAIAEDVETRGEEAIPLLLRRMLHRLAAQARGQAG
ncbi:DUF2813 domain-containing protein [Motilimonas pumila]|uniref:DUF2813 domain-containing protein n=1 Tax=Motilimonas pumila TaxID=2303987 RepID=A0A418YCY5_9GAMM|nr:DUF2813 domain-containing protein [Motilimonas pumila]RJG42368.1 DUF2813 domain-containing protein [Motilimonas pumila]